MAAKTGCRVARLSGVEVSGDIGGVLRSTSVVVSSRLTLSAIGFFKYVVAAYYFGTSNGMDVYLVALVLPDIAMSVARTGVFNFIPLFAAERVRSEQQAWRSVSKMLTYWMLLLLVASVTAFVATPFLLAIVAPGFAKAQNIFASNMTRVLFFMALAVGAARILAMVLYADKKFLAGSVSEVVFQATTMSYLVAFHDWGVSVLAWGMVTGGFAQLFVVGVGLWDRKKDIRFSFDLRGPEVRKTVRRKTEQKAWPIV